MGNAGQKTLVWDKKYQNDKRSETKKPEALPEFCCEAEPEELFLVSYTNKPPAMRVDPLSALALDNKTSNVIISEGPKPHYI